MKNSMNVTISDFFEKIYKQKKTFIIWEIVWLSIASSLLSFFSSIIIGALLFLIGILLLFVFCRTIKDNKRLFDIYTLGVVTIGTIGIGILAQRVLLLGALNVGLVKRLFLSGAMSFFVFPIALFLAAVVQKDADNKLRRHYFNSGIVNVFIFYLLVFWIQPLDIFIHNIDEIPFSLTDSIMALIWFLPFLLLLIFVLYLLPKMLTRGLSSFFGAINIAIYIQSMFFNKYIGQLIGNEYQWNAHPIYTLINIIAWLLVVILMFFFGYRKKTENISVYLSVFVALVSTAGIIYSFITASDRGFGRNKDYYYYLDGTEQFTIGKDENVVLLIADAVDNSFINEILNDDPSFFDEYNDFTLYTNTCSVYDYTSLSVSQMLYGYTQIDGFDKTEEFLSAFKDNNYRVLFYEKAALQAPGNPGEYIDNYDYTEDINQILVPVPDLIRKNYMKVVGYRILPCILKKSANVKNINFDRCIRYTQIEKNYIDDNEQFNRSIDLKYNSKADKCFIYQHLNGAHCPCDNYVRETKYCLNSFKEYIKQMKDLGVYDNSVIIIAADHGIHDDVEGVPYPTAATPMLIIKRRGEKHDKINISSKPVYYQEFQSTIISYAGLENKNNKDIFGKTIDDYGENDIRTRVWFDTDLSGKKIRKYTFLGDTKELERVVNEGIYEIVETPAINLDEVATIVPDNRR